MATIFEKGDYQPIDGNFMTESVDALRSLSEVQERYKKGDIDNFLNELHDSMVGYYLGFKYVNIAKHGFDCKYSLEKPVFLESKVASFAAKSWAATFNDTTLEKASAFKGRNLWVALSVWKYNTDLLFVCYGRHRGIGEYLEAQVEKAKRERRRSTQTIGLAQLIRDYGFRILAVGREPAEISELLVLKSPSLKKYALLERIDTVQTFQEPYFLDEYRN